MPLFNHIHIVMLQIHAGSFDSFDKQILAL